MLEQTEECQAKCALDVEKLLEEIRFKYLTMKALSDNRLLMNNILKPRLVHK